MAQWHYLLGQDPHGPIEGERLREMIRAGELPAATLVWTEGQEDWAPAHGFEALVDPALAQAVRQHDAGGAATVKKTEPLAIWSMVLGILGLFCCACPILMPLGAVVSGHIAYARVRRDPKIDGEALAVVGMVTGYLGILLGIFSLVGQGLWYFTESIGGPMGGPPRGW